MPDHQPAIETLRYSHELFGLTEGERKRLFDKHVLASLQRSFSKPVVQDGRCRDRNSGNACIRQHLLETQGGTAVLGAKRLRRRSVLFDDGGQGVEGGEIAHRIG